MARLPFNPQDLPDRDVGQPARRERSRKQSDDALTVSELTDLIKGVLIESMPAPLRVVGEVSNLRQRNGHWFLSLKDEQAVIDAVVWASTARRMTFQPEQGQQVLATGKCDFYGPQGKLQLYLDRIDPIGEGALERRLRQLIDKLREAGYFAEERKRALPAFPQQIAVITSKSGAALQDVIRTAQQRWAGCRLFLLDVRVQGAEAAEEIAAAICWLSKHHQRMAIDAAIVTRGGGSLEDLWCFNEPVVAEAIFHATLPIVAAIGHETDTTVAELVADLRCSTPTQAAAQLVPDARTEQRHLDQIADALATALRRHAMHSRQHLESLARHEMFRRPDRLLDRPGQRWGDAVRRLTEVLRQAAETRRRRIETCHTALAQVEPRGRLAAANERLTALTSRLTTTLAHSQALRKRRLEDLRLRLESVGPASVLQRGFSYTTDSRGRVIRSVAQARPGQPIRTRLTDGTIDSHVDRIDRDAPPAQPTRSAPSPRPTRRKPPPDESGGLFDDCP